MTDFNSWKQAQAWELDWHHDCVNSFNEEEKQLVYAEKIGLVRTPTPKTPYTFNLNGNSILDIGGGAYSLLLKCEHFNRKTVVADPLMRKFPSWVRSRYDNHGLIAIASSGEDIAEHVDYGFDEVWIYNVLQHTQHPELIVSNAKGLGTIVRLFEWVDTPINIGHIHTLTEENLNKWLGGEGKVEIINQKGAKGKCYYGVFKGDSYATSNGE